MLISFPCYVLQYKYQINIDGTVAAYRFPYLLGGDSLVLKQDSDYYEHFYKDLEPYKHYVPLKHDLSDLLKMIQWAKDHDEQVGVSHSSRVVMAINKLTFRMANTKAGCFYYKIILYYIV